MWPPNPFLLMPTFPLSLGSSKAGVPHSTAPPNKEAAFVTFAGSGRFRGAALENSRDFPGRTEIKPKEKYKWRKKEGQEAGLERNMQRWRRGRERCKQM